MAKFSVPVPMLDGTFYNVKRLLAKANSNTKIYKSEKSGLGITTVSLSLAPASESGFNLCTSSSAGCRLDCLYTSGRAQVHPRQIQPARIAKSRMLRLYKSVFHAQLSRELELARKLANRKGLELYVRLNVLSDVMWEREFPQLLTGFNDVTFYDYTKHFKRMERYLSNGLPKNYHLTFSWAGPSNLEQCLYVLKNGGNVAVPFDTKRGKPLPDTWQGFTVVDGDVTDLRPLDPQGGYVIGLRAKGKARKDRNSGFVVPGVNS